MAVRRLWSSTGSRASDAPKYARLRPSSSAGRPEPPPSATMRGSRVAVWRSGHALATDAAACPGRRSRRSAGEEDHLDGLDDDEEVQKQRAVLDVVQVVLELLAGLLERCAIVVPHLRPPGDPGSDDVPEHVERDSLLKLADEDRAFRARPDQAHVTAQDVDELRELVEPRLAQEASQARDAGVADLGPDGSGLALGVDVHRAQLEEHEHAAVLAHALLPEEHGPRGIELAEDGKDRQHGKTRETPDDRDRDIEGPTETVVQSRLPKAIGERQPARPHVRDVQPGRQLFIESRPVLDLEALHL